MQSDEKTRGSRPESSTSQKNAQELRNCVKKKGKRENIGQKFGPPRQRRTSKPPKKRGRKKGNVPRGEAYNCNVRRPTEKRFQYNDARTCPPPPDVAQNEGSAIKKKEGGGWGIPNETAGIKKHRGEKNGQSKNQGGTGVPGTSLAKAGPPEGSGKKILGCPGQETGTNG